MLLDELLNLDPIGKQARAWVGSREGNELLTERTAQVEAI
jgi:hypothetical protein